MWKWVFQWHLVHSQCCATVDLKKKNPHNLRVASFGLFKDLTEDPKIAFQVAVSNCPEEVRICKSFFPPNSSVGKESNCNAGELGWIPGLGRSPGEGKGYPLQYSGLENYEVAKSRTRLSNFHFHLLENKTKQVMEHQIITANDWNQTSQVSDFTAFLWTGRCKSLGSSPLFLWHAC